MSPIWILVLIVGAIGWFTHQLRVRAGKCERVGETASTLLYQTSFGAFRFDKAQQRMQFKYTEDERWESVPFEQIGGLQYGREESAGAFPAIARGATDVSLFRNPVTTNACCFINLELTTSGFLQFYCAYQIDTRLDTQRSPVPIVVSRILSVLKLFRPVDDVAEQVYEDLKADLEPLGLIKAKPRVIGQRLD
ncbi:MAG: hypothetical protein K0U93_18460 [Gammaproteobacteria bacterium]|nr:hypothetical protein [Gammaproteobacteria bacterium]